jgi:hypothetical protein
VEALAHVLEIETLLKDILVLQSFRAYLTVLGGRYVLATISFCVKKAP